MQTISRLRIELPWLFAAILFTLWMPPIALAQEKSTLEVSEWSLWIGEPNLQQVNSLSHFPSAMPGVVDTVRSRVVGKEEKRPSPLSMITFHGQPQQPLDVDLRVQAGRFIAHWPPADTRNNRLRWFDSQLISSPSELSNLAFVPASHWFHQARDLDSLYLKIGTRAERFIAYDAELSLPVPIKLVGGPDKYQVINLGIVPLHDLVLVLPTPTGRRIGWLDRLPAAEKAPGSSIKPATSGPTPTPTRPVGARPAPAAVPAPAPATPATAYAPGTTDSGNAQPAPAAPVTPVIEKPVDLEMSAPLAVGSEELIAATTGSLKRRLLEAGLKDPQIEFLLGQYRSAMFESESMTMLLRLPAGAIEDKLPLVIEPEPKRLVRVPLMLVRNIDPQIRGDIQALITQLGHSDYKTREAAEKRLMELGRLATPSLKEALKNPDAEIAFRVERLLLYQKEPIDGK